jgi:hypothetical protein
VGRFRRKKAHAQELRFLIRRPSALNANALVLQYASLATARFHEASIRSMDNAPGLKVSYNPLNANTPPVRQAEIAATGAASVKFRSIMRKQYCSQIVKGRS